ncbi:MAG: hypothetical protein V1735_03965 [Nanoarchaeota archaeon]
MKLGRRPEKLVRKLVDVSEMKAEMETARVSREKYEAEQKAASAAMGGGGQAEEKKEEAVTDPQVLQANLDALKELGGQCRDNMKIADWARCNELLMEIGGLNVGKDHLAERGSLIEQLKGELELAKNPPPKKQPGAPGANAAAQATAAAPPAQSGGQPAPPAQPG